MRPLLLLPLLLPVALAATPARAAEPAPARPHAYAVVVGSNAGGAGQAPLRFAEDDARSVADVLRQLGHYAPESVVVLLHPDARAVLAAIDDVAARVRVAAASGESSKVVFYYSGHARAAALTPGGDDLPLTELRARLSGLPSTLTLVVLDACQSGAFARVKGAEPAADFTYNSVSHLTQKGLAVMASSTSQELSQESDELRGSYFTHHLVTALRGAGDSDGDGRVSLDEAYRYAYRRTLASTARTQVGEQHVTLETDLAGQGDVPVTYPAEARAQLEMPAALEGHVLVQQRGTGAVAAELQKAADAPVHLALVAGGYDVVVGRASGIVDCKLQLVNDRVAILDTTGCAPVVPDRVETKGDSAEGGPPREIDRWAIEGSAGFIVPQDDAYTQRLETFSFQKQGAPLDLPSARLTLGASRVLTSHLAAVLAFETLTTGTYQLSIASNTDTQSFSAYDAALYLRAFTDVAGAGSGSTRRRAAGLGLGVTSYQTEQTGVPPSSSGTYAGYVLGGAAGVTVRLPRRVTLFAQGGWETAPIIHDLIGDTHDSGGPSFVLGARVRLGDAR